MTWTYTGLAMPPDDRAETVLDNMSEQGWEFMAAVPVAVEVSTGGSGDYGRTETRWRWMFRKPLN